MVLVTGHHIERDPRPGLVYHIQQILHLPLENIDLFRQPDVISSLGDIGTQSGAHAARQHDRPHPAGTDGIQSGPHELLPPLFDPGQLHHLDRCNLSPRIQFLLMTTLLQHRQIRIHDLRKQRLLLSVAQFLVIL